MTIYKVCEMIDNDNKIFYQVIPYSLIGTLNSFFSKSISYTMDGSYGLIKRFKNLFSFFERCYLTKEKANKEAKFLSLHKDLEW